MNLRSLFFAAALSVVVIPLTVIGQRVEVAKAGQDTTADRQRPTSKLEFQKWSGDLNVPDPVAISFDTQGRAFVTQTLRRKIQDLDIRQNRDWISNDLSLQSVNDKIGFYRSVLAPVELGGNSKANQKHVQDVNGDQTHDYRDLTVISEKIHLVEDTNRDGTADKIGLFAEDFKTEVTGIAAGVLAVDDWVIATIAPDVWKLRDTNNDGRADVREKLATGFGIHIAYAGHDMHGLTMGPDGKVYWSIGDKGVSTTSRDGRRFHFPNQGAVMRCNIDGSEFEVFAHGLRNVQELAFDQFGNLFGFDNDSDQPQERERFINIVHGMDAGWRCNYQYRGNDYNPWMAERMWEPINDHQPAHIIPPIVNTINGPCGFAFNPGTALSPYYKDYFFLTGTLQGEQIAFKIQPDGDSFKMTNEHRIGAGLPLIGINFGPEGALYGVDWAGGYPLNQKGAIWKIDVAESLRSPQREETSQFLASEFDGKTDEQLAILLSNPDQRVRLKAQFTLVRRHALGHFLRVAANPHRDESEVLGRIHAIWGLGQLVRQNADASQEAHSLLQKLTSDPDPQIRIQVARTLGDTPQADGRPLVGLLNDSSEQVRVQAALAIGRLGTRDAFDSLVKVAANIKPTQVYLRHAVASGLAGIESRRITFALANIGAREQVAPDLVQQLLSHENRTVRLVAAVTVRKLSREFGIHSNVSFELRDSLNDKDQRVATEIARAIYDDFSIGTAMPDLAAVLSNATVVNEAFLRRSIGANFRLGRGVDIERVARFAANPKYDSSLRLEAIKAITDWQTPHVLDRVTGRYRETLANQNDNGRTVDLAVCEKQLLKLLNSESSKIQTASLKALRSLDIGLSTGQLIKIFNSDLNIDIRIEALNSLVGHTADSASDSQVKSLLTDSLDSKTPPAIRVRALQLLAQVDPNSTIRHIQQLFLNELLETKRRINRAEIPFYQSALSLLGKHGTAASDRVLSLVLDSFVLETGILPEEIRLETLEAAEKRDNQSERIQRLLQEHETRRESTDVGDYAECLEGGNPAKGKALFNTHVEAQCVRCHRIGKKGSTVGPNLDGVASAQASD